MTDAEIKALARELEIRDTVEKLEASLGPKRYFLKLDAQQEWSEVTQQQWIIAERNAGFYPKYGKGEATGGFTGHGVAGKVEYSQPDENGR